MNTNKTSNHAILQPAQVETESPALGNASQSVVTQEVDHMEAKRVPCASHVTTLLPQPPLPQHSATVVTHAEIPARLEVPTYADDTAQDDAIFRAAFRTFPTLALAPSFSTKFYEAPWVIENNRTLKPENYDLKVSGEAYWADSPTFADPADSEQRRRWLQYQNLGNFKLDAAGRPLNPAGGSTVEGRGELGYWGPNPASDNLNFRWKPGASHSLQIPLIQRRSGIWALAGGMKDEDESFRTTAAREGREEMGLPDAFEYKRDAHIVYAGFVVDRRNTRHAWMITAAFATHHDDEKYRDMLQAFTPQSTLVRSGGKNNETLDAQWFDVDMNAGFLNGVNKDGEQVKLDLHARDIPDTYGEDKQHLQRTWAQTLPKARADSRPMFASHGALILAAKSFVESTLAALEDDR